MSNTIENAVILLHPEDTVVVAKKSLPGGTRILISEQEISTLKEIPAGHKVAIRAVAAGDPIIKYDQIIGFLLPPFRQMS